MSKQEKPFPKWSWVAIAFNDEGPAIVTAGTIPGESEDSRMVRLIGQSGVRLVEVRMLTPFTLKDGQDLMGIPERRRMEEEDVAMVSGLCGGKEPAGLPEQIEQLKEDYERRIAACNKLLNKSKGIPTDQRDRLEIKRGEYQAFLSDLNRLKEPQS